MDAGVGEARRAEAKQAQLSILDEVVGDQLTLDSRETSRKQQRNKAAAAGAALRLKKGKERERERCSPLHRGPVCVGLSVSVCVCVALVRWQIKLMPLEKIDNLPLLFFSSSFILSLSCVCASMLSAVTFFLSSFLFLLFA